MDPLGFEACSLGQLAEDQECSSASQAAAAHVEKEFGPVASIEVRATACQVLTDSTDRLVPERDKSLFVAFADTAHKTFLEVNAATFESDSLADA